MNFTKLEKNNKEHRFKLYFMFQNNRDFCLQLNYFQNVLKIQRLPIKRRYNVFGLGEVAEPDAK